MSVAEKINKEIIQPKKMGLLVENPVYKPFLFGLIIFSSLSFLNFSTTGMISTPRIRVVHFVHF